MAELFSADERAATDRLLTTTRTVRRRLDLDRPVPRDVIAECLEIALHAPNGGNAQRWRWVVVDDPDVRVPLAELYREALVRRMGASTGGYEDRMTRSIMYLAENLQRVPVLVVPCTLDRFSAKITLTGASALFGSVMPAAWSLMLALHSRGLGSAWTTVHLDHAEEAAALLGIPARVTQLGLMAVAYTTGGPFRPAPRDDAANVTYWNRWVDATAGTS
jgi:nitroreductase